MSGRIDINRMHEKLEDLEKSIARLTTALAEYDALRDRDRADFEAEIARLESHVSNLSVGKEPPADLPPIRPPAILRRLGLLPKIVYEAEEKAEPPAAKKRA